MDKLKKENLKNIIKLSSEDFLRNQKKFFKEIENCSFNIKLMEKSKNYLELQKEIEKLKKFIHDYNIKYLKNINEEQIKFSKKLIESLENKFNTIKMQIALTEKKKLIEKKMHEKYLERRNTSDNDEIEDSSLCKRNEKEISNKKLVENIIESSSNLLKFYEIFKQISKENQSLNKLYQNPNLKNNQFVNQKISENKGFNNNFNTNPLNQGRIGSINNNNCDFNLMNRLPSVNFNSNNNNINFESYFILDNKNMNNHVNNNNFNVFSPCLFNESHGLNNVSNENINISKYIDEIKQIKNCCIGVVEHLTHDPNSIKKSENDISILKDEILKEYLRYKKLKKHIKNITTKYKD